MYVKTTKWIPIFIKNAIAADPLIWWNVTSSDDREKNRERIRVSLLPSAFFRTKGRMKSTETKKYFLLLNLGNFVRSDWLDLLRHFNCDICPFFFMDHVLFLYTSWTDVNFYVDVHTRMPASRSAEKLNVRNSLIIISRTPRIEVCECAILTARENRPRCGKNLEITDDVLIRRWIMKVSRR